MNRKNLTAAVLAGLAGAAGIAGTAQAVNLNPDGLGQVLIYPYYTSNDGNSTLLSVVNTSSDAKAVKVRFKEGFNSREVLDFNMYMSAYDVWAAAISDVDGTPTLEIPDSTCTVPYLYEHDVYDGAGHQAFLPWDYSGDNEDGGPTGIARAAEGHFEVIEMGTLTGDSAADATHVIDADGTQHPKDCQALVDAWTGSYGDGTGGYWLDTGKEGDADYTEHPEYKDLGRNSGGLFGGAAIINVGKGTMFSYDARAIQGFDTSDGHLHTEPGTSHPSLADGNEKTAFVFFGAPRNEAVSFDYDRSIDAVSAVFMHGNIMNEFNIDPNLHAASEWVVTFPTKNWYVDAYTVGPSGYYTWEPDANDTSCNGWHTGAPAPNVDGPDVSETPDEPYLVVNGSGVVTDSSGGSDGDALYAYWHSCTFLKYPEPVVPIPPFTSAFNGEACEPFQIQLWDREESAGEDANNPNLPIVSPAPPGGGSTPGKSEICYEVNVLRFGNDGEFRSVFGTPDIGGDSILKTVDTRSVSYDNGTKSKPILTGWGKINLATSSDALLCESGACRSSQDDKGPDWVGLQGLPVTGFWAEQFENGFLANNPGVLANYGGLFNHKGSVRRSGVQFPKNTD